MGCCVSTHKDKTTPKHLPHPHTFPCVSKSPPRPEEEAVKEVLSETPKPKPKPIFRPASPAREEDVTKSKLLLLTPKKPVSDPARYPDPCATPEEISEVSEMCSFSESISTNTLKEDDDYSHLLCTKETASSGLTQRVFRSQGYNGNYLLHSQQQQHYNNKNVNNQGRSPARRRPEPSPPRRKNPGQCGPRREMGGDNLNRRSQSPGVRGNVGRSPSARRNGPSPGRVRMVSGPEERKKMEVNEEERREREREKEHEEWQGPKESLENPLVSLECFIFL